MTWPLKRTKVSKPHAPPSDDDLAQLKQRVEADPDNLQYRFELGAALFRRHDYTATITELHRAKRSPTFRLPAMRLLVELFDGKGMTDLAAHYRTRISRDYGDEGNSGSAPVPDPPTPPKPLNSAGAKQIPTDDLNSSY